MDRYQRSEPVWMTLADGKQRQFAFEDVGAFLRFLGEEIGIT